MSVVPTVAFSTTEIRIIIYKKKKIPIGALIH